MGYTAQMDNRASSQDAVAATCEARLSECGIRPTGQRVRIASLLLCAPQHLSAEQILANLRSAGARVSKATVYNTLKLFIEKKLIRELIVDSTCVMYDPNPSPHHHFYDVESGRLTDIPGDGVRLAAMPELPPGTVADGVEIIIRTRPAGAPKAAA